MQRESTLTDEIIIVLEQGLKLIEQIDDELYCDCLPPFFNYAVGSHFRHLLDFYNCFFAGLEHGRIDYDSRERDELLAKDRLAARARIRTVIDFFRELPADDEQKGLSVRMEDSTSGLDPSMWAISSLGRELQFLLSHTVHHYALISLMLRLKGFEAGREFGVAPSTLSHWKAEEWTGFTG